MVYELGVALETVEMDCALTVAIHSAFHNLLDKVNVLTKFGSDTVVGVEITKAVMVRVRPQNHVARETRA
jgi:hypothetical protein